MVEGKDQEEAREKSGWVRSSQVPQPTCYWKWVGSTIPLKQDNLTLQASRAFNMARILKEVLILLRLTRGVLPPKICISLAK